MGTTTSTMPKIGSAIKGSSGIIGNAMGYNAQENVVEDSQLVSKQMDELLASDSPYIKRAQDISKMQSNSRGLINSTMASQAGTAAAIDSAMPIAQQDAGTYAQSSLSNTQFENQSREFNAGQQNNRDELRYQADANMSQFNAGQQNARDDLTFTSELQNSQFNAGMNFDKLRLDQDRLLSNLDVAARTGATITTNFMDNWTALMTSDVDGKDVKGRQLMAETFGQLSMIGKMTGQEDSVNQYIDNIYSQTSGEKPQQTAPQAGSSRGGDPVDAKLQEYIAKGYTPMDSVPSLSKAARGNSTRRFREKPERILVNGVPYKMKNRDQGRPVYVKE